MTTLSRCEDRLSIARVRAFDARQEYKRLRHIASKVDKKDYEASMLDAMTARKIWDDLTAEVRSARIARDAVKARPPIYVPGHYGTMPAV